LMAHVLSAGDYISLLAPVSEVLTLHDETDFQTPEDLAALSYSGPRITVEAVQAGLGGGSFSKQLGDLKLDRYGIRLLGLNRHQSMPGASFRALRLRAADRLLLEGTAGGLAAAAEKTDLINITSPRSRSFRRRKAPIAILAIAAVVLFAAADVMPIEGMAFLAVAAILGLRCIDVDEAWQFINADVLMLIFAMLAIGTGMQKTGAVHAIVEFIDPLLRNGSPVVVLFTLYFLTVIMTELVTNNAVAVILTPIAIGVAESLGLEARPLVVAVMFGASSSFATPIGYQTNTMVYGAADYKFTDFLKIGIWMDILVGIANCTMIYLLFPLTK